MTLVDKKKKTILRPTRSEPKAIVTLQRENVKLNPDRKKCEDYYLIT